MLSERNALSSRVSGESENYETLDLQMFHIARLDNVKCRTRKNRAILVFLEREFRDSRLKILASAFRLTGSAASN